MSQKIGFPGKIATKIDFPENFFLKKLIFQRKLCQKNEFQETIAPKTAFLTNFFPEKRFSRDKKLVFGKTFRKMNSNAFLMEIMKK